MSTSFTAMTWNVENLFPPGHLISTRKAVTEEEYSAKLEYLAQTILTIRPDVLALQEIGGSESSDVHPLDDLQSKLNGQYPHKALSSYPDLRGIRVGFLARFAINDVDEFVSFAHGELASVPNWYPNAPSTRMGRGALRIDVEPSAGVRIQLITVHLKSKLITYPGGRFAPKSENERTIGTGLGLLRRAAEAVTVRQYLNNHLAPDGATHTIVLGDFNDEPRAATTQMFMGPEDADATSADKLDPVRLYNLVDGIPGRGDATHDKWFLPPDERFSRINNGRRELIDHLFVSKSLLGPSEGLRHDHWKVTEVHSLIASILNENITDNPADRVGKARPDHAPIYARFEL
ncbi:MAG TPA: endonuclease/exonuclease/phosphatase family protein [Anaerolineae bacterium]|nr:endonuclease/exonuclease/phosphatase family protein [Anaerolineae bacterium]